MIIKFCESFTAMFTKTNTIISNGNLCEIKTLEIDLEKAKQHIEACEFCSTSVADLIDNFSSIISPMKMIKLLKTIKG